MSLVNVDIDIAIARSVIFRHNFISFVILDRVYYLPRVSLVNVDIDIAIARSAIFRPNFISFVILDYCTFH